MKKKKEIKEEESSYENPIFSIIIISVGWPFFILIYLFIGFYVAVIGSFKLVLNSLRKDLTEIERIDRHIKFLKKLYLFGSEARIEKRLKKE